MTRRTDQIGFSQRVRLEWLDRTVNLILAGNKKAAVNDALQELLKDKVSVGGQAERGTREKIITILLKTWLTVPTEIEALRDDGLDLLKRVPRSDHLAIHWGMVTAVYPFWSRVPQLRLMFSAGSASNMASGRLSPGQPAACCARSWIGACCRKPVQRVSTPPG
jgi:hypothetical protein